MSGTVKCRECAGTVARMADPCPHCGARHPALSARERAFAGCLTVAALFALGLGTCMLLTRSSPESEAPAPAPGSASATPSAEERWRRAMRAQSQLLTESAERVAALLRAPAPDDPIWRQRLEHEAHEAAGLCAFAAAHPEPVPPGIRDAYALWMRALAHYRDADNQLVACAEARSPERARSLCDEANRATREAISEAKEALALAGLGGH